MWSRTMNKTSVASVTSMAIYINKPRKRTTFFLVFVPFIFSVFFCVGAGGGSTEVNKNTQGSGGHLPMNKLVIIGHFRVPPGSFIKTRLSAQPLIWKWLFILMQIKFIFTRKAVHLASFSKWGFLELGSGLLGKILLVLHLLKSLFLGCFFFGDDWA